METHEIIKDIKSQFRSFMNGQASKSMRDKGLDYKVNWGIELPRLKEIASQYDQNFQVAEELWKDNVRECKILAGLLMPVEEFNEDMADSWIENIHNPEIAQLTCMNLFQNLPFAKKKSFEWMADDREYHELCGFTLMGRLLMKGEKLEEREQDEFLDQSLTAIQTDNLLIGQAAANALRKFGRQDEDSRKKLGKQLTPLLLFGKEEVKALAGEIKSDIEYSF